jgi:hypothetical protein
MLAIVEKGLGEGSSEAWADFPDLGEGWRRFGFTTCRQEEPGSCSGLSIQ